MAKMAMRKLTLLGAKHLLRGGHISKTVHRKMVKAAKRIPKLKLDPQMDPALGLPELADAPLQFGAIGPAAPLEGALAPSQGPAIGPPMGMLGLPGNILR